MTAKQKLRQLYWYRHPGQQGELGLTQNWASVVAPFWKSVTQKSLHAFNIIVSPPAPLSLPQSLIDSCKLLIKMSMHIASFILSVCKYKETNITPPPKKNPTPLIDPPTYFVQENWYHACVNNSKQKWRCIRRRQHRKYI